MTTIDIITFLITPLFAIHKAVGIALIVMIIISTPYAFTQAAYGQTVSALTHMVISICSAAILLFGPSILIILLCAFFIKIPIDKHIEDKSEDY